MVWGLGLNKNEKASWALTLMNVSASSTWVQCDQQPHAATSMLRAMMKYTLKQWAKQTLPATAFVKCFVTILRKVDNIFTKGNWDQVRRVIWSFVSLFLPEIHSPHRQIRVFSHLHSSSRNSFKMCFRRTDAFLLNTTSFKDLILHLHYQTHPDDSPYGGGEGGLWGGGHDPFQDFFQLPQDPNGLMWETGRWKLFNTEFIYLKSVKMTYH